MSYILNAIKRTFSTSASPEQARLAKETVEGMLQSSPVAVFSKSYCPYCMEAKHILKGHGQESRMQVLEIDHDNNGGPIQAYLAERIGQSKVTVPQVYIGGKLIGGCSDLKKLHKDGLLEKLLAA
ncbi:hypothetical protein JCM10207_002329 [Rhodosporidiobolus poonsookiae]